MASSSTKEDHDLAYFLSIPSCASILSSPEWTVHPTRSRDLKPTGEDALFAVTLKTPLTIPYCLTVARSQNPSDPIAPITEVRTFVRLERGLNGYPDVCHGGILATLIDEIIGVAMYVYRQHEKTIEKRKGTYVRQRRNPSVTAELTVQYLRPTRVPGDFSVVVWPPRVEGRKLWADSEIQDEKGQVVSKGTGLFVQVNRSKI